MLIILLRSAPGPSGPARSKPSLEHPRGFNWPCAQPGQLKLRCFSLAPKPAREFVIAKSCGWLARRRRRARCALAMPGCAQPGRCPSASARGCGLACAQEAAARRALPPNASARRLARLQGSGDGAPACIFVRLRSALRGALSRQRSRLQTSAASFFAVPGRLTLPRDTRSASTPLAT
jgi:hypothetical protein